MPEEAPQEKIIGLPETIFMTLLVGVEEFAEFGILVITLGAGIIVVEVMNGAVGSALEMYMALRGGKGVVKLIVQPIGSFINGISGCLLPGKTVAMLTGIWVINHPEIIDKAINVVGKFAGSVIKSGTSLIGGTGSGIADQSPQKALNEERAAATRHRIAMGENIARMPIKK